MKERPSERDMQIHCARVYIAQARARRNSEFAFVLLQWAANCRLRAFHFNDKPKMVGQMDLFA